MKTNLGRSGTKEGKESLQAKFCNLIVPLQEEMGEQNAPKYILLIAHLKTSQPVPVQIGAGASGSGTFLESEKLTP